MVLIFTLLIYCNYYEMNIPKNVNSSSIITGQINALIKRLI